MTPGFLDEVTEEIRREIRAGGYATTGPRPSERPASLARALRSATEAAHLLVEYKRASPGRADPKLPQRSVEEFVASTDLPEVVGYSCLATRARFDGSPALVQQLAHSTRRPVLYKDFVIDPVQIENARQVGAAAVLLIARLEGRGVLASPLKELADTAHRRGLEVVLELHAPEERRVLDTVDADAVGVNVRDLDTLKIERATALRTLEAIRGTVSVPLVGLSGIETASDVATFVRAGCSAVLVGSSVALASDPAAFLRSLIGAGAVR
jgi:indole-3-glycerol phosphate synthase